MSASTFSAGTLGADSAVIEHALADLWRAEAEALERATGQPPSLARVLLLNLVIYSPDPAAADEAREASIALNPRQPSRTIVMENRAPDPGAPEKLEAWVTLHCALAPGGRQTVCGEQITLEAAGAGLRHLPGAVLPLLLANVPAFLWWQRGAPFGSPLLRDLTPAMDRLIVDSLTYAAPGADLGATMHAVADPYFHPYISDLSWARLAAWRYQTAQIFDDPAMRPYLKSLAEISITHDAGSPVMAWLFAAWLGARLSWQPAKFEGDTWYFVDGPAVNIAAQPVAGGHPPGSLARVALRARDGAAFVVERAADHCLLTRLDVGGMAMQRVTRPRDEGLVTWLGHELNKLNATAQYESALYLLAEAGVIGSRKDEG